MEVKAKEKCHKVNQCRVNSATEREKLPGCYFEITKYLIEFYGNIA